MGDRLARVVLVGVLVASSTPLGAEEGGPARVRVTVSDRRLSGKLVAVDETALLLRRDGREEPDRIPLDSVTSLERQVRRGGKKRGLWLGLLSGAAIGAVAGYAAGDDCGRESFVCFDRPTTAASGAILFGVLGTAIGAIVAPGEKWEATTADRLQLDVGPGPGGGVGARLTLRF
jgi:hypothetical protein